jgi:hypothetical protein
MNPCVVCTINSIKEHNINKPGWSSKKKTWMVINRKCQPNSGYLLYSLIEIIDENGSAASKVEN